MSGKHGFSVEVIERNKANVATVWLGTCGCKTRWVGDTYEQTEDKWRQHVHSTTGNAPEPMGGKQGRWTP